MWNISGSPQHSPQSPIFSVPRYTCFLQLVPQQVQRKAWLMGIINTPAVEHLGGSKRPNSNFNVPSSSRGEKHPVWSKRAGVSISHFPTPGRNASGQLGVKSCAPFQIINKGPYQELDLGHSSFIWASKPAASGVDVPSPFALMSKASVSSWSPSL